jgi:hypothetical protein
MQSVRGMATDTAVWTIVFAASAAAVDEQRHDKRNNIGKRDLSDQQYYNLAVIHASGKYVKVSCWHCRLTGSRQSVPIATMISEFSHIQIHTSSAAH